MKVDLSIALGKQTRTPAMKAGSERHAQLEAEVSIMACLSATMGRVYTNGPLYFGSPLTQQGILLLHGPGD